MNHHEPLAPVIASALAAIAVAENIWVFTAFVVVGAMAGVYYASLAKNPPDDNRTKKAKWVVGMISGVGLPSLVEFFYPPIKIALGHPLIVLLIGFTLATLGSILIHKVFVKLDGRMGDKISDSLVDGAEKVLRSKLPGAAGGEDDS